MTQSLTVRPTSRPTEVDPRGPRFAAAITTVVLALVLALATTWLGLVLLVGQVVVFAIGAFAGPAASPYARLYRRFVRPRLGPPAELEDVRPLQFAQQVGLVLAPVVGIVAVGFALAAAFLNAAFGLCLGCEAYLLIRRARPDGRSSTL
jgi:Domain of unknown function (DUF4395)